MLEALEIVFGVLWYRVCVVETHVRNPAKLASNPEVQAYALSVPDVEISVWLWGESRGNGLVLARLEVGLDHVGDEMHARLGALLLCLGA